MPARFTTLLKEYLSCLVLALIIALFIRSTIVCAYVVPSGSMQQTLKIGDHLLVNMAAYDIKAPFAGTPLVRIGEPEFGDIVVFRNPNNPKEDYIKRVVGLPGDTIEIKGKRVFRNGKTLDERYVVHTDPAVLTDRDMMQPTVVPADRYFVLGDNRDNSYDSRFWGFVDREEIKGKALVVYWSRQGKDFRLDRIGKLPEEPEGS